jgi:DNA mismatch repair protein MutS2
LDNKDLELLEFPLIRQIIADFCGFSLSKSLAMDMWPSDDPATISKTLGTVSEARVLLEYETSIGVSGLEDIQVEVEAASHGIILDGKTLSIIRSSLDAMRLLRDRIVIHRDELPEVAALAVSIGDFSPLVKAINRAISVNGEILPDASPRLETLRRSVRDTRAGLVEQLQSYISTGIERNFIQEPVITEREGRYVIEVKSERRADARGIVHDMSNTGATIFVEPWQTVEMGNSLKQLQIEEAREIDRILSEISELVGKLSNDISDSLESSALIDLALAKARYASVNKGAEAEIYSPESGGSAVIRLVEARHPLLGAGAVPLSLEIGNDFSILMITGPNTGGKTVALKTIGLMSLMTQSGIPIPAAKGTRLPILKGVFADIGDEQSITETLSTFGWHMSNISRILKQVESPALVVLDEIGASTDPQEGAALARAIIQHLLEKHIMAVVTTHYTELKVFAHVTEGLQNASFGFDPQTLKPTYRLRLGTPGGSNAIATASSFGLPRNIISVARNSLSQGARELEELLSCLQTERNQLEVLSRDLEIEKRRAADQGKELGIELKRIKEEKRSILQETRDNLVAEVSLLHKELKLAEAALRRDRSEATINKAQKASQEAHQKLKQLLKTEQLPAFEEETPLHVGDRVFLKDVGTEASITSVNERTGQIEASSGAFRFLVNRESVQKVTSSERQARPPVIKMVPWQVNSELDLRGRRAEEVETLLDSYLSDAAVGGLRIVRIIHGFGTGTVRSIVREQAARHPLVKSFHGAPSSEGGEGATILDLK